MKLTNNITKKFIEKLFDIAEPDSLWIEPNYKTATIELQPYGWELWWENITSQEKVLLKSYIYEDNGTFKKTTEFIGYLN